MLNLIIIAILINFIMIIEKKRKRQKRVNKNIKLFNIGSSHGLCSFDYTNIKNKYGINCYNFGWHSQTFYYDYIVLKNYFNNITGGICFIPISYFSFADKKCWNKEDLTYRKTLKFYLLEKEEKKQAFILQYLPLYVSIKKKIKKIMKNNINEHKKIKTGVERIKKHVQILEFQNEENSLLELKKIIKLLNSKNIKIILITTPFQKKYNDYFKEELLNNNFYRIIDEIKNKYELEYYDFSHSYGIFNKDEYFNDYDHLSEKGAEIFMQEIEKILIEKKYL